MLTILRLRHARHAFPFGALPENPASGFGSAGDCDVLALLMAGLVGKGEGGRQGYVCGGG